MNKFRLPSSERVFTYEEPGYEGDEARTFTETQIMNKYWFTWCEKMRKINRPDSEITRENCIDDWVVVNWAKEVKPTRIYVVYRMGDEDPVSFHKTKLGAQKSMEKEIQSHADSRKADGFPDAPKLDVWYVEVTLED